MIQKFWLARDDATNALTIKEYAVVDGKPLRGDAVSRLTETAFTLLCQEAYSGESIARAIAQGPQALIRRLRTRNFYPVAPHALRLAEAVSALYDSRGRRSDELIFDGSDLVQELP
jgi:hypothetical protein